MTEIGAEGGEGLRHRCGRVLSPAAVDTLLCKAVELTAWPVRYPGWQELCCSTPCAPQRKELVCIGRFGLLQLKERLLVCYRR